MKIGIFDSGIGGVSVLHEALTRLPDEEYIFYADVDHVPYGVKTTEQVVGYVDNIVAELIDMGVDAIVIACNTATSVAASYVREKYNIPIIGMEPAVKPAVELAEKRGTEKARVLVMATPITIRENKLQKLLEKVDHNHIVDLLPMPGLVRFAEAEMFEGDEVDAYLAEQTAVLKKEQYSGIVLGCTHFNYFKPAIKKCFEDSIDENVIKQELDLIDGNEGTINHLAEVLELSETSGGFLPDKVYNVTYVESGRVVTDEASLKRYRRLHDRLDIVKNIK